MANGNCCSCEVKLDKETASPYTLKLGWGKCRECNKKALRKWNAENKERKHAWYESNKELTIKRVSDWIKNNPSRRKEIASSWARKNYKEVGPIYKKNLDQKMKHYLRSRIRQALRGEIKSASTEELTGCSMADLRKHLESLFKPGMNWLNYGRNGWHVDHIKPCALFNMELEEQQKECFNYKNLQPLWEHENISKGKKY